MKNLALNAKKAMQSLGWRPRLSERQALEWTLDWYRRFDAGEDARALTVGQIERYEELAANASSGEGGSVTLGDVLAGYS